MRADTLVYERKGDNVRLAALDGGKMCEIDVFAENKASEGNVYLGKITHKMELANGRVGFMVNIGDNEDAFMNAYETDLKELNMTEGQSVVVQVAQEKRAEKGAKVVRNMF